MEQVFTPTPIPLDVLKRKFTEELEFVIDYPNSKLKGKVFLTYLSNLGINCSLHLPNVDEALQLVAEYLKTPSLVSLPELEDIVINLLLHRKGDVNALSFDPTEFIDENLDSIQRWERRIQSLPLFAISCISAHKDLVNNYPVDEDASFAGINFVHLIKHPAFTLLIGEVPESAYTYNPTFFNEHVFAGKNLFHYFAVQQNPLFLSLLALSDPETGKELAEALEATPPILEKMLAENKDVPLI